MGEPGRGLPTLGRLGATYEIVRELGRGGTAVVYLARDRELERDVAIKVIRSTFVEDEEAMARLIREAKTVAALQHPNIVMLYGTEQLEDNSIALIMQYVPGRSLKDLIRSEGALTYAQAGQILVDVARALAYAHRRRIVHRDIKPENIYLDEEAGVARLSDFGIARPWDTDSNLTLPGMALGTPAYMSPEQIDGGDLDGRSDVFSLGLVGYEMLTGQQPWAGENLYTVIYRQKKDRLPSLSEVRTDIPPHLERAIEVALEKERDARWADADDFIQQILAGPLPTTPAPRDIAIPGTSGDEEGANEDAATIMYRRLLPPDEEETGAAVVTAAGTPPIAGASRSGARPGPPTPEPPKPSPAQKSPQRKRGRIAGMLAIGASVLVVGLLWGNSIRTESEGGAGVPGFLEPAGGGVMASGGGEDASPGSVGSDAGGPRVDPAGPDGPTEEPTPPEPTRPAAVEILSGDAQAADPGVRVPDPLVVRVADEGGEPVGGALVRFAVAAGGGFVSPDSVVTDENGRASAQWMLGLGGGPQEVTASVDGLPDAEIRFSAELAGPPPPVVGGVAVAQGDGQQAAVGDALPQPVVLRVDDTSGQPMAGVPVRFDIVSGGGLVSPDRGTTDSTGHISVRWVLGTDEGDQSFRALVQGLERRPLTVSAVAVPRSLPLRRAVVAGGTHTCALTGDGTAYCWGGNQSGQLGDGGGPRRSTPGLVDGTLSLAMVTAGFRHTCALAPDGRAYCWGANENGQLGDGGTGDRGEPTRVQGGLRFTSIHAGVTHTCALAAGGAAYCWGLNGNGQLGDGTRASRSSPGRAGPGFRFDQLAVGWTHTCGLAGGSALCWGRNSHGQLGDGTGADRLEPTAVNGDLAFTTVSAGSAHTCGVTRQGDAYCWGQNTYGQLGDGSTQNRPEPVRVANLNQVARIVAGGVHTCALTRAGSAYCWGRNTYGQLGDGTTQNHSQPIAVQGEVAFSELFASGAHTCGTTPDGRSYCWGYNVDGQLGDGSRSDRPAPTPVLRLPR